MKRIVIRVTGIVQGVGYRARFANMAISLRCTGFVRNLPDGSVEAVIEGELPNLQNLLEYAYAEADPYIRVRDIRAQWGEPTGEFPVFRVKYDEFE